MLDTPHPTPNILTLEEWQARAHTHRERVLEWTAPHKELRSRQEQHPVHDFLFQYYMYSPAKLEAWHPEPHEAIAESPEARGRFGPPVYRILDGVIERDMDALSTRDLEAQRMAMNVLVATQEQPANFGCYGVHEWAMVYGGHDVRHGDTTPLRLSQREVDDFVESRPVACSHFDAFRFFAPQAKPLNRIQLEWSTRFETEQPGCIHANMDIYRWAYSAMPWIGSNLLWECFELAAELRVLDMQASPYDLRHLELEPVCVETPQGRMEYQLRQRELAERAAVLRTKLIGALESILAALAPLNTHA
jgi:hypothetical protein